jgi:hypothetical protein
MKNYMYLKMVGLVLLAMIILVSISVIEVAVYSYFINPGQPQKVYEDHAEFSAPFISGIFGFVIFFGIARYWTRKGYPHAFNLAMRFAFLYLFIDVVIILLAGIVRWSDFILIFLLANGAKFTGSYLGYKMNVPSGAKIEAD